MPDYQKTAAASVLSLLLCSFPMSPAWGEETSKNGQEAKLGGYKKELPDNLPRFTYHSGLSFTYPNAVRGIYVSGNIAGAERFNELLKLVDSTDLNAMVIDIKNDSGNLTYKPGSTSPYQNISQKYIRDPKSLLKTLEQRKIYPIARVVVFKDTELAHLKPEWSYMDGKSVWKNGKGDSFVNPFLKEVWDYNVGVAIEAAKMGFQEIQFDYVRFPEGFEKRDSQLKYSQGDYQHEKLGNVQKRVKAVSDFVAYAREKLKPYDVKVSVDIFGYTATLPEAPGIGQNFSKISENVDAISSMIYPSHWTSYFGIDNPDLEPYKIVSAYSQLEKKKLEELKTPPISRPWIQDFTASWLGQGHYKPYGKAEVEAQIKALKNNGISEFLLWNAGSRYTSNVDYTP